MSKTAKWLLWGLYAIALVLFFAYYLFPSDALREYAAALVKSKNPDLTLRTKRMTPAFPPGVTIHGADILSKDQVWFEAERVSIGPRILSLFGKDKVFSFRGLAWKGNFDGRAILSDPATDKDDALKVETDFSGIRAEQINVVRDMAGKKLTSGILGGNITYHRKKAGESFESKITMSGIGIEIVTPLIKLPTITFKSADADIVSADMKIIEIKKFDVKGDQANGNIGGTITVRAPFEKSLLNLKVDVTPTPAFLSGLTKSAPAAALFLNSRKSGPISVAIGGTIEQPTYSLR